MNTAKVRRTPLSVRATDDLLKNIDDFRREQLAIPTQTEALKALVRIGFEAWRKQFPARAATQQ